MRIGVIGAGNVGSVLAEHLAAAGCRVAIANSRSPETLLPLVDHIGTHATAVTASEAAEYGEVVMLALPFGHYGDLHPIDFAGRVAVDAMNYYPDRDGHLAELDSDQTTSSELVQHHLPGAHVVKAFNAIRAAHLRDYRRMGGAAERYGIPVAGDDDPAKRVVLDLVELIGFEPVDVGTLAEGGRLIQPGSEYYLADLPADELHARIGVDN
jgi:8-hydroxy-5-deazaflavin:NADPH oxidoreductase